MIHLILGVNLAMTYLTFRGKIIHAKVYNLIELIYAKDNSYPSRYVTLFDFS